LVNDAGLLEGGPVLEKHEKRACVMAATEESSSAKEAGVF
jgi:hypothetical protein